MLQRGNMFATTFIATLLFGLALGEYTSPVFLWGTKSTAKSSLQTIPQEDFAQIVSPFLDKFMVVAFQEENLSSRDFLCQTDNSQSCYAQLQGFSPKTYYASVQNPTEALRSLTESREYNIVDSTGKLQAPLECSTGKVTFVSFDDVNDDKRDATLEAHDAAIKEITKELSECPVVYLYMSTPTNRVALKRQRRDTAAAEGGYLFREGSQFMIFWTTLTYNDGTSTSYTPITITGMTLKNATGGNSFDVSMASTSGKALTYTITLGSDGYFTLSNLGYDGKTFYTTLLNAPTTFSYHCGNLSLSTVPLTEGTGPIAHLQWNSVQFQAPFDSSMPLNKFSDAWDCVPFFSPAILSGLFVVIILLGIMFTGICWMVDINTMDRFDDPKGKTITINASD